MARVVIGDARFQRMFGFAQWNRTEKFGNIFHLGAERARPRTVFRVLGEEMRAVFLQG